MSGHGAWSAKRKIGSGDIDLVKRESSNDSMAAAQDMLASFLRSQPRSDTAWAL